MAKIPMSFRMLFHVIPFCLSVSVFLVTKDSSIFKFNFMIICFLNRYSISSYWQSFFKNIIYLTISIITKVINFLIFFILYHMTIYMYPNFVINAVMSNFSLFLVAVIYINVMKFGNFQYMLNKKYNLNKKWNLNINSWRLGYKFSLIIYSFFFI